MAQLEIAECGALATLGNDAMPALVMPPRVQQQVAIGGASVQSAAFGNGTYLVRVQTDVACRLAFGANPTAAATSSVRMAAETVEVFNVLAGDKVAVIAA